MKQLPGVFVLMSRKRRKDYKKVLQQILKLLPSQPVAERLVTDFEDGLWRTIFKAVHSTGTRLTGISVNLKKKKKSIY